MSRIPRMRSTKVDDSLTSLTGGLDLETPSLSLKAGFCRDAVNFEASQNGGYSRIAGYERIDGQAAPSAANYQIVEVAAFVTIPSVGQVITQATSTATGTIAAVGANYMAVTKISGTFDSTHGITTPGPITVGTAIPIDVTISSLLDAQYTAAAADIYRALIAAVPGSGNVLGFVQAVFSGTDNLYAFRANTGGSAIALYKTTASGWTLVPFFEQVAFTTGGSSIPADGATLTQGSVTATVKRVVAQSGDWAGTDAAGIMVITTPAGGTGHFTSGAATLTGGAGVVLTGAESAITMTPGGKFEFQVGNFGGQAVTTRIYGCDGTNKAFEFDGAILVPIATGLTTDAPKHLAIHRECLILSYQSSLIYSGPGTPYRFGAGDNGGEIAVGDSVTGLLSMPGSQSTGTLAIYCAEKTAMLYGTDALSFNLIDFNTGSGGYDYSLQNMADSYVMSHLGVVTLETTLYFGNFNSTVLTRNIQTLITEKRSKIVDSHVVRSKSQYRVYFNDGFSLWLTIVNGNYMGAPTYMGAMPIYFPDTPSCVWTGVDSNGDEVCYFGGENGMVYQMETGTSFDGANIDAQITLAWDALKSPRVLKRYRSASIEMQGSGYASINFGYQLGYGSMEYAQPDPVSYPSGFVAPPTWDAFTWDEFVWDGQTLLPTNVDVTGDAENIQVVISSTTNYIAPYTVNSVIHHYSMRRGLRN